MWNGWNWLGWGMVVWLTGSPAWSADPDPEEVRRRMEIYLRDSAAEEAAKKAPAPKPQPKPAPAPKPKPKPKPKPEPAPVEVESAPAPVVGGPKMVSIKGGRFRMGSPTSETGREPWEANERQHDVSVKDFELGQTEVTVGEFRRFVAASGYRTDAEKNGEGCYVWKDSEWQLTAGFNWRNPGFQQGDDHPVVCVSWNDANRYADWLSQRTGRTHRLPTEAEWEYAARAGTTSARYWGDDPDQACRYASVADQTLGWTPMHDCRDGYTYTAPVGSFKANAWGLKDMLGNVWEWTCSAYDKEYGGAELRCTSKDTTGPLAVRGGSWTTVPDWVRSANRYGYDPPGRLYSRGFRLARSL